MARRSGLFEALLYLVMFALASTVVFLLLKFVTTGELSIGSWTAIAVLGVFVSVLLWRESTRDRDAVVGFLTFLFLVSAGCAAIYAGASSRWNLGMLSSVVFLTAATAWLGIPLLWAQYVRDSRQYPNLLEKEFTASRAFEKDGVQFNGGLVPSSGQDPHWIQLFLQNCFDRPRLVRIRLDAAGFSEYLRFHPEEEIELEAGEVAHIRLPVVSPTYAGTYKLFLEVDVEGTGGARVRRWRGTPIQDRVQRSEVLFAAAGGMLLLGGGLSFRIGPLAEDIWSEPLREAKITSLWKEGRPRELASIGEL